ERILVGIPRPFPALTMEFGGQGAEPGQLAGETRLFPDLLTCRGEFGLQPPSGVLEQLEAAVADSGLGAGADPGEGIGGVGPQVGPQCTVPGPGPGAREKRALPQLTVLDGEERYRRGVEPVAGRRWIVRVLVIRRVVRCHDLDAERRWLHGQQIEE